MTRSSEVSPIIRYECNGTTLAFPTVFQFFDEDELKVVFIPDDTSVAETTLTLTTNYTVSGGDGSTGTVTTTGDDPLGNDPYDDGDLVIIRETPLTQEIQSRTTGAFRPPNIEDALDKTCDQMMEREALSEFALRLPDTTDMTAVDSQLPTLEASKFLAVNASGMGFVFATTIAADVPVTPFAATLLDDITAASGLQTLGLSTYIRTLMDDPTAASALETLTIPTTTFMRTLLDDVDAATARATLAAAKSGANTDIISLTLASGQITFPGTAFASADVNTLDDYEEGTFGGTGSNDILSPAGSGTITCGTNGYLSYVKTGAIVFVNGILTLSSASAPAGTIQLELPFTVASLTGEAGGACCGIYTENVDWTAGTAPVIYIPDAATKGSLKVLQDDGAVSEMGPAANDVFGFSFHYRTE